MTHRDPELDKYIGKKVRIKFKDNHCFVGYLQYIEEFSSKYDWRKPNMYSITLSSGAGYISFRKSFVARVDAY